MMIKIVVEEGYGEKDDEKKRKERRNITIINVER